jgi:hypothetical protein
MMQVLENATISDVIEMALHDHAGFAQIQAICRPGPDQVKERDPVV